MDRVAAALGKTTYSELARQTGTTVGYISYLFHGKRAARMDTLARVSKVLKVGMDELHQYLTRVKAGEITPQTRQSGQLSGQPVAA
jgi:transcriptional regulator with XRE-family HTH domain